MCGPGCVVPSDSTADGCPFGSVRVDLGVGLPALGQPARGAHPFPGEVAEHERRQAITPWATRFGRGEDERILAAARAGRGSEGQAANGDCGRVVVEVSLDVGQQVVL
ncbi:hypothetical protein GCM10010276_33770 [Streptomyces longisporus]|uniref:Uncharacterized protein n=1 Tax=Streptomyces longisporus TaxID=1948 RepID=A0ABP5Z3F2_STRLO